MAPCGLEGLQEEEEGKVYSGGAIGVPEKEGLRWLAETALRGGVGWGLSS